jgi:hypothetical protein
VPVYGAALAVSGVPLPGGLGAFSGSPGSVFGVEVFSVLAHGLNYGHVTLPPDAEGSALLTSPLAGHFGRAEHPRTSSGITRTSTLTVADSPHPSLGFEPGFDPDFRTESGS